ncbi:MAG TPA: sporulation protein YqfD [Cerasibacillus sp.]|uniref:sporulation protein YqfD n=1 Tax=Cerasibacillus sp. TaxID=2498711 RepID=UPI002F3FC486
MKQLQISYLIGYVTVQVKGMMPERFFQACVDQQLAIWNIEKTGQHTCIGSLRKKDIRTIKEMAQQTEYSLKIVEEKGLPYIFKNILKQNHLLIGLFIAIISLFLLSNIVWRVEISGFPKELEQKIMKTLKGYGVYPGALMFRVDSPSKIQQQLLHDLPELLWVGIEKKGTSFQLEGVEKIIVEKEKQISPQHLIAAKDGVIQKIFVSKGVSHVATYDYVKKGDLLVSGNLLDDADIDENEKKKDRLVAATGEVIAKTWYEVDVTIPLKGNDEQLTGKQTRKFYLNIFHVDIPIWNFSQVDYALEKKETVEHPLYFLNWRLPFTLVENVHSEKELLSWKRTKKTALDIGIEQAYQELRLLLGPKAKILSNKVLHEAIEHDKVILTLYVTVEENIAKPQPIIKKSEKD